MSGEVTKAIVALSPGDIINQEYAVDLIKEIENGPQFWVYVISKVLSRPTPPEMIQTREGPAGSTLTYVTGAYAVNTLAALFRLGICSDFDILDTVVSENEVDSTGKLTLKFWHNKQWSTTSRTQGGCCIRRKGVALGLTRKGSYTDTLKKCLNGFGWAMDVYTTPAAWSKAPSKEDMAQKSLDGLYEIGRDAGIDKDDVDKLVLESFGKPLEELSVAELVGFKRKLKKGEI